MVDTDFSALLAITGALCSAAAGLACVWAVRRIPPYHPWLKAQYASAVLGIVPAPAGYLGGGLLLCVMASSITDGDPFYDARHARWITLSIFMTVIMWGAAAVLGAIVGARRAKSIFTAKARRDESRRFLRSARVAFTVCIFLASLLLVIAGVRPNTISIAGVDLCLGRFAPYVTLALIFAPCWATGRGLLFPGQSELLLLIAAVISLCGASPQDHFIRSLSGLAAGLAAGSLPFAAIGKLLATKGDPFAMFLLFSLVVLSAPRWTFLPMLCVAGIAVVSGAIRIRAELAAERLVHKRGL